MPSSIEHASRQKDPSQFDSIRRSNNEFGSGIHVLFGIKDGKSEVQSIKFDASKFSVTEAKQWLRDHNFKVSNFEEALPDDSDSEKRKDKDKDKKTRRSRPYKKQKEELTDFPNQGDNKKVSLSNSKYRQFDYRFASNLKADFPSIWKKAGTGGNPPTAFTGDDAFRMWTQYRDGSRTSAVLSWVKRRERYGDRHAKNTGLNGTIADIKWGLVNTLGISGMKKLINEEKAKVRERENKTSKAISAENISGDAFVTPKPKSKQEKEEEKRKDKDKTMTSTRRTQKECFFCGSPAHLRLRGIGNKKVSACKSCIGGIITLHKSRKPNTSTQLKRTPLSKAEEDAPSYRLALSTMFETCDKCAFFNRENNHCGLYEFTARPNWVCDSYVWRQLLPFNEAKRHFSDGEELLRMRKYRISQVTSFSDSEFPEFDYEVVKDIQKRPGLWKDFAKQLSESKCLTDNDGFIVWGMIKKNNNKSKDPLFLQMKNAWFGQREQIGSLYAYEKDPRILLTLVKWGITPAIGKAKTIHSLVKLKDGVPISQAKEEDGYFDKPTPLSQKEQTSKGLSKQSLFQGKMIFKDIGREKRIVSGPVLVPEELDFQGHIISADEIERTAHDWMRFHLGTNIMHTPTLDEFAKDVRPVESIVLPTDLDFYGTGEVFKKGTWVMSVHIGNDDVWKMVQEGVLTSFSIEGEADFAPVS